MRSRRPPFVESVHFIGVKTSRFSPESCLYAGRMALGRFKSRSAYHRTSVGASLFLGEDSVVIFIGITPTSPARFDTEVRIKQLQAFYIFQTIEPAHRTTKVATICSMSKIKCG